MLVPLTQRWQQHCSFRLITFRLSFFITGADFSISATAAHSELANSFFHKQFTALFNNMKITAQSHGIKTVALVYLYFVHDSYIKLSPR